MPGTTTSILNPITGEMGEVKVKTEKQDEDDREIQALADEIAEANKLKLAQTVAQAQQPLRVLNGASNLRGFMVANGTPNTIGQTIVKTNSSTPIPEGIDGYSAVGKFSWSVIATTAVPVLLRKDGKYISVRIMETLVLSKHLNYLHPDIYLQARVHSYDMTDAEYKLMNEINLKHCEGHLARDPFSSKDLVVRLTDAIDFYKFLDVCYHKLHNSATMYGSDKCGFIRINEDSVIPYTVKDGEKFVPIFYFEGETDKLKTKSEDLTGWELAYLKFCCKVQGIKNELFNNESCAVTSLKDIKSYFSGGDVFEEYWPSKVIDSQQLISATKQNLNTNSWIRAPPGGIKSTARPLGAQNTGGVITMNGGWAGTNGTQPTATQRNVTASMQQQILAQANRSAAAAAVASRNGTGVPTVVRGPNGIPQYYTSNSSPMMNGAGAGAGSIPPPLVRAAHASSVPVQSSNPSSYSNKAINSAYNNITPGYKTGGWTTAYSQSQIRQMMAAGQIPVTTYPGYQSVISKSADTTPSSRNLAPPPLIPVNGVIRPQQQRYYAQQTSQPKQGPNTELIDLSSPPSSPKRSSSSSSRSISSAAILAAAKVMSSTTSSLQHPQSRGAPLQQSHSQFVTQTKELLTQAYGEKIVDSIVCVGEISVSSSTKPYKLSKTRLYSSFVLTINGKPFDYNEDILTTISDFVQSLSPAQTPKKVLEAFHVVGVKLYMPNSAQLQILNETKKYRDVFALIPMVKMSEVKENWSVINYIIQQPDGALSSGVPTKRPRTS